jgi:hypothetical protein
VGSNGVGSERPADAARADHTGSAAATIDHPPAVGSATQRHPPDRTNTTIEHHVASGSGSAATLPVVPVERHKVTINSEPWSYFTVDDDPASHQTVDQVMLPPGPHRIHFKNPQLHLEREITLDVADHDLSHVEKLE